MKYHSIILFLFYFCSISCTVIDVTKYQYTPSKDSSQNKRDDSQKDNSFNPGNVETLSQDSLQVSSTGGLPKTIETLVAEKTVISVNNSVENKNKNGNALAKEKLILSAPNISFANDIEGVADNQGIIKAVDTLILGYRGIQNIDYPFIIWDPVDDAQGYKIYRKHDGMSHYQELTSGKIEQHDSNFGKNQENENSIYDSLSQKITSKYYYQDISLSPTASNLWENNNDSENPNIIRKYYYKVSAISNDADSVDSNETSRYLLPLNADAVFNDIFKQNLQSTLYCTNGFRAEGSSTYNNNGKISGTYTKKILGKEIKYAYNNYAEYKGAIVINGTLTAEEVQPQDKKKSQYSDKKMVIKRGKLFITGPYKATVTFTDFVFQRGGRKLSDGNFIDKFLSGDVVIVYHNNEGNELDNKTYIVGGSSSNLPVGLMAVDPSSF